MAESNRLYEGMFLMDQQGMAGDLNGALEHVRQILDRAEAEVLALRKWDDRRLAYEINGQRRGTFLLALFRVDPDRIGQMERACNLSEQVLRVLFTRADHMGEVEIEQVIKEATTTADEAKLRDEPSKGQAGEGAAPSQAEAPAQPAGTSESGA